MNKALLIYSRSCFLHTMYGCFQATEAESGSCIRDLRAQEAKNIYFMTLYRVNRRRKRQPTPVFSPGESQGRGSLVGCCLWGRSESDTTEVT